MKSYYRYRYLILALLMFSFGKLTDWNVLFPRFDPSYAQKFQKIFSNKEREIQNYLSYIEKSLNKNNSTADLQSKFNKFYGLLDKEGLGFFIYRNDSLVYWSDNTIVIDNKFHFSGNDSNYVNLRNAWFVPKIKRLNQWKIVGLMQIKQVYLYENNYLVNEFQRDFNFPSTVKISSRQVPDGYPIFNSNGSYLFSLVFDKTCQHKWFQLYIPVVAYFLAIIFFAFFLFGVAHGIQNPRTKMYFILFLGAVICYLRYLSVKYQVPGLFYELDLFSPQNMAISQHLPSMGDLLLWIMVLFFFTYLIYKQLKTPRLVISSRMKVILLLVVISGVICIYFFIINDLIKGIIMNSSVSFEAQKVLLLSFYSFIGFLIFMMLFASFAFFIDKLSIFIAGFADFKLSIYVFGATSLFMIIVFWYTPYRIDILPYLFFLMIVLFIGYVRIYKRSGYQYTGIILIVLVFAFYTVERVVVHSLQKNRNETKILASNLANQHDAVAEYSLEDCSRKISKDTIVMAYLFANNIDGIKLSDYLSHTYFDGYFEKYKLQVIPCHSFDSLFIAPPDNFYLPCFSFFNELVQTKGSKLPTSSFYYLDNQNGGVSYLGWFDFINPESENKVSLYIELDSKVIADELGYPELLLDKKVAQKSKFKDFSYAKYYNGRLITKFGFFPYDLSSKEFVSDIPDEEFTHKKSNGFNHLVYKADKNTLIVISYPKVGFFEILIAFSWIFLFYILVATIITVFANLPLIQSTFQPDFKNKIQYSIMAVLFTSLILIGGGTILFSSRQYNNRHYENLAEKMRSIYVDVAQKIGHEEQIGPGWQQYPYNNLDDLLARFSDVFYVDINLFDLHGNLIGSSRPEIFEKGLIGTKMDPNAYNELYINKRAQFIHNEKIGRLSFLSGYIPLLNHNNEMIAYLNIPYFTRQEELSHEISTLVVGIVNVYVILLLISIVISVLISRSITMPLRLIQKRFGEIKLGQNYDKIEYEGGDEIGGLVQEYNRMVEELSRSIEMLAKSERESAWREMARQIAHEINNPLTPMKLSVQHLLRAWYDKSERFDDYIERISQTLIEEIDNLSSIATEFSNFAKMPLAHNQTFNLVDKINNVVNLFANSEADFMMQLNGIRSVNVFADKEQVSRVFINLFKNAIQSVDKGVKPLISLDLSIRSKAIVMVKDNGKGIPEDLRDKLFRPNFTTKSSGMGLGLAISKNIMEGLGGSIRFITETDKGTTFILEFPVSQGEPDD